MKTDLQMQQDVRDELMWDTRIRASTIGVSVKDGVVAISGEVPHFVEKTAAEEAAQRVRGVKAVVNNISVKVTDSHFERNDIDIAEAAASALRWNYEVPDDIKISVSNGHLTLRGNVQWAYEKNAAVNAVKSLMGVLDVSNQIEIKTNIQSADIKSRIESAFKRSAVIEGKGISVAVNGHNITLTGVVHCLAEKNDAKWAAFCAPGVSHVENLLTIKP